MENIRKFTALEVFMSMPDDLLVAMLQRDPEGIQIMCLALGIELSNAKNVEKIEFFTPLA
jgi:hypothetical protein